MTEYVLSKEATESQVCRESFYMFVKRFWYTVVPETPIWNWHIEYLCNELQILAEDVFAGKPRKYDLIINIPPGSTKSTICSVMFPVWLWTRDQTIRTICGSYTSPLSVDLGRKSRLVMESEKYRMLFPEITLSEDQNAKGHFVTEQGGSRLSTMVGSSPTGFHAHFLLVDDPLDPGSSVSKPELLTANNWMKETLPTRAVNKEVTVTILIMQRLHQNDPTGEWLKRIKNKKDGVPVKHICLPAEISNLVSPPELREKYVDGLLDPVRLSRSVLADMKSKMTPYATAAQFDQNPIPRGGGDFKVEQIQIMDAAPRFFKSRTRYWDKAGTMGGGAYTAGALLGEDRQGNFWILHMKRGQWDAFEREKIIKQMAEMDGKLVPIYVEQEPGSGGKESAQRTIRMLAGYKVYADRPVGDKKARAEPFAAQVNAGNVRMLKGDWNFDVLEEMAYWPNSEYKDQVDALDGAFAKTTAVKKRAGALA